MIKYIKLCNIISSVKKAIIHIGKMDHGCKYKTVLKKWMYKKSQLFIILF